MIDPPSMTDIKELIYERQEETGEMTAEVPFSTEIRSNQEQNRDSIEMQQSQSPKYQEYQPPYIEPFYQEEVRERSELLKEEVDEIN